MRSDEKGTGQENRLGGRSLKDPLPDVEKEGETGEKENEERLSPDSKESGRFDTVRRIDQNGVASMLAEIGPDKSVIPLERDLACWGGWSCGKG